MIDEHAAAATGAADGDPEAVIVLDDVRKEFGTFVAVEQADFAIRRGEFFSLLGPSGCGKTTLLKMIAGFEQPTSGPGRCSRASTCRRCRRTSATSTPSSSSTPCSRTCRSSTTSPSACGPRRCRPARPAGGRWRCSTSSSSASSPTAARASSPAASSSASPWPGRSSTCPAALLLDEPLAALDLKLREAMQIELKRIQREVGITFIFVTHDQGEALTMSDRIAVMSRGRVEQIGTPDARSTTRRRASSSPGSSARPTCCPARLDGVDGGVAGRRARLAARASTARRRRRRVDGDPVTVMLRPERLTVGGDAPATTATACRPSSRTSSSRAPSCG